MRLDDTLSQLSAAVVYREDRLLLYVRHSIDTGRHRGIFLALPAYYAEQGLRNGRVSVLPSVCPIIRPQPRRAAGLLLSAVRAGDIDRQRRAPGSMQQRRSGTGPQHGAQQQMRAVPC